MTINLPNRASDAGPNYETFRSPDEDGWYDTTPMSVCDGCNNDVPKTELQMIDGGEPGIPLFLCAPCVERREEEREPVCTCTQTDVDLFDARGCEAHDRRPVASETRILFTEAV